MAKVETRPPSVPTSRPPTVLSAFEEFVQASKRPPSIVVPLYHSCYLRSDAADRLISFLPRSTILTLRAVSRTIKNWAHKHHHDLLTALHVTCPLPRSSTRFSSKILCSLGPGCRQLTIHVLPSATQIHVGSMQAPSPARQIFNIVNSFQSLRVDAPLTDAFYPLFSLRLALEQATMKSLTELHFHQLTVPGLLGLRWGGFDAFVDATWMGKTFWRGITSLRVGMTTDWLKWAYQELYHETNAEQRERMKRERDIYRQGIQILHDWFFHFSLVDNMRRLCFEWVGATGPNPFLLDDEVAKEKGSDWFSAPGITWKGVQEVWLGGVYVDTSDVTTMKLRFDGLEKLMVWEELSESIIFGTVRSMGGRDWLDIDLTDDFQRPIDVRMPEKLRRPLGLGEPIGLEGSVELKEMIDDGETSMLCPFVLRV